MTTIFDFFKKYNVRIILPVALLLIAAVSYGVTITNHYPLVDYDEAIYAKVVVDTLESGDILSLNFSGSDFHEKPPLYFWLAMGAVKIFGAEEFAFRLPAVIATLVTLWLVYLLMMEFTGSRVASATAFLILLFSPAFFVFAKGAQLDSGVIMAMLAALFFFIKGWQNKNFLFWIFPAIAVGFLFKSVTAFLIVPIIFLYSFAYKQWVWLKNKHLWTGFLASLVLLIPWHALQSFRFGLSFWNEYLGYHIFQRVTSTITGSSSNYDYVRFLWLDYRPWIWVLLTIAIILLALSQSKNLRPKIQWKQILTPLFAALFILSLLTLARTHLIPYMMPVFPFLAMFIALSLYYFRAQFKRIAYILPILVLALIIVGSVESFATTDLRVAPLHYEEREVGQLYKKLNEENPAPLHVLNLLPFWTLAYYGDTTLENMAFRAGEAKEVQAPLFIITSRKSMPHFFNNEGIVLSEYENIKVPYKGKYLVLLYSDQDLKLPIFFSNQLSPKKYR